ncbi:MAG: SRPBCC family protein [Polyangiales bacterium]
MEAIHQSIDINGSMDSVFAYVENPSTHTQWLPSLMDIRHVTGSGTGQHYEWTYKMAGVPLEGQSTVIAHVPNERLVIRTKGSTEAVWTFVLAPRDGGTRLDLTVEYTIPLPVLGKLAEKLVVRRNERELAVAVQNIKDHCES